MKSCWLSLTGFLHRVVHLSGVPSRVRGDLARESFLSSAPPLNSSETRREKPLLVRSWLSALAVPVRPGAVCTPETSCSIWRTQTGDLPRTGSHSASLN